MKHMYKFAANFWFGIFVWSKNWIMRLEKIGNYSEKAGEYYVTQIAKELKK